MPIDPAATHGLNASLIYDAVELLNADRDIRDRIANGMKALGSPPPVIGEAFTMRLSRAADTSPENRLKVMEAYDSVPEGCVLVIQAVGDLHGAVIGDVLSHRLKHKGVKAVVVDGPVRDVDGILKYGPPAWASDVNMAGMKTVSVKIETQIQIEIGGVPVNPGDLVAADVDGVMINPAAQSEEILAKAGKFAKAEMESHERIDAGAGAAKSYLPKT